MSRSRSLKLEVKVTVLDLSPPGVVGKEKSLMVVESKVEVPSQVELTIFWTCVLFFAQVFRSSQSTSQVSREKSPMVVVGGLSHRPSLMSEFSQSA